MTSSHCFVPRYSFSKISSVTDDNERALRKSVKSPDVSNKEGGNLQNF